MAWLTLSEWDEKHYKKPHSISTLRKWARERRFHPAAERHGRDWMVREDAVYRAPDNSQIHRLRQASNMIDPDVTTDDIDPRVLEILNNGSCAA